MSENLTDPEFRSLPLSQSYLASQQCVPTHFGDLFELVAYRMGKKTHVDLEFVTVCFDVPEKLGFVLICEDAIKDLEGKLKGICPFEVGSQDQHQFAHWLRMAKFYVYMFMWNTRSLLDALSVHLNTAWRLGFTGTNIWIGASGFRGALRTHRGRLVENLDKLQGWYTEVDKYRLYTIHREPLMVVPNSDPLGQKEWDLCIPKDPKGSLRRFILGNLHDLDPILDLVRDRRPKAELVSELVSVDTREALKGGELKSKVSPL